MAVSGIYQFSMEEAIGLLTEVCQSLNKEMVGKKWLTRKMPPQSYYGQTKVLKGIDLQIQDQDDVAIPWSFWIGEFLKCVIRLRKGRLKYIFSFKDKIYHNSRMPQLTAFRTGEDCLYFPAVLSIAESNG